MKPIKLKISPLSTIDKEKWEALYRRSAEKNVYNHYTYIDAVKALPERFHPDHLITGFLGDQLVLVQLLRSSNSLLGSSLEFFKPFWSDHVEPLCDREKRREHIQALLNFILAEMHPDLIFGRALSESFTALLKENYKEEHVHVSNEAVVPYMILPDTMEAFWALFKSKTRNSLRRRLKVAKREGLEIRIVEPGKMPPGYSFREALNTLREFYELRWADRPKDSLDFCQADIQNFHARFCESKPGALSPHFVEILDKGKVIGSSYGLKSPHSFVLFQHGFKPEYRSFGIGDLLALTSIEYAIENGIKVLDFKQGEEPFKFKWTDKFEKNFHVHLALTFKGRIMLQQKLMKDQLHVGSLKGALGKVRDKVIK